MSTRAADVLVATSEGLVDGRGTTIASSGQSVDAIATSDDSVWLVVDGSRAVPHDGAGAQAAWDGPQDGARLTSLVVTDGGDLVVGTEPPHLFRMGSGGARVVAGFDDVPGRDTWTTPWGGPPAVRSMAPGPDGTLYVNVHVGGIVRHDASGWEPTIAVDADVHEVAVADDGTVLAATARGLAVSRDRGRSWDYVRDGLHGPYCRAVAVDHGEILLSASTGPSTTRGAIYRTTLEHPGLDRVGGGLPDFFPGNVDSGCIASRGDHVALGSPDGAVYVSADRGRSWERTAERLATIHAVAWTP